MQRIEKFLKVLEDLDYMHIFGTLKPQQLGAALFFTKLEFYHFAPGSEKRDEFNYNVLKWKEIIWGIISIPAVYMEIAKKVADGACLKIVPNSYFKKMCVSGNHISVVDSNIFILDNDLGRIITEDVKGNEIVEHLFRKELIEISLIKEMFNHRN